MGATLAEFRANVQENLGRDDKQSLIDLKVNSAILDIILTLRPPEALDLQSFTTVAGTDQYALTADVYSIQFVAIINTDEEDHLTRGALRAYATRRRATDARGRPQKWIRRSNNIHLFQAVPDDNDGSNYSIEIFYIKRPTTLVNPTDTSDLNDEWDEATELLATSKVLRSLRQFDESSAYFSEYTQLLSVRQTVDMMEDEDDDDAHAIFPESRVGVTRRS